MVKITTRLHNAKMNFAVDIHVKDASLTITVPKQGKGDWIRFVTRQLGENISVKIEDNTITEVRDETHLYHGPGAVLTEVFMDSAERDRETDRTLNDLQKKSAKATDEKIMKLAKKNKK